MSGEKEKPLGERSPDSYFDNEFYWPNGGQPSSTIREAFALKNAASLGTPIPDGVTGRDFLDPLPSHSRPEPVELQGRPVLWCTDRALAQKCVDVFGISYDNAYTALYGPVGVRWHVYQFGATNPQIPLTQEEIDSDSYSGQHLINGLVSRGMMRPGLWLVTTETGHMR